MSRIRNTAFSWSTLISSCTWCTYLLWVTWWLISVGPGGSSLEMLLPPLVPLISLENLLGGCKPVLRIHDILGWIRIRGSMPLTNGSGFGSWYYRRWPSRCQQKTNFFNTIFLLITFWSYIYIIFQRWKVKKSHKIVGIKVFLTIFAWW